MYLHFTVNCRFYQNKTDLAMKIYKKVFVTVGTTKFNELIKCLQSVDVLDELQHLGCERLLIQLGTGDEIDEKSIENIRQSHKIEVIFYRLKPNIAEDIASADLVISHAGAGSCIEVLNANKTLMVVVNEELMDNHQTELAEKLGNEGYLLYCKTKDLNRTLEKLRNDDFEPRHYEKGNMKKLIDVIDGLMGY